MAQDDDQTAEIIEAQKRFYELRAPDYLTGAATDRRGSDPDRGLPHRERRAMVELLPPGGDVLELGCGPGGFTRELARRARTVTAVDSSPAMLARNEREVDRSNVSYVQADVFTWRPDRSYDLVFFGFLLSHVPPSRFEWFWQLVRSCLNDGARVAFVDEDERGAHLDDVELVDGVPTARRTLRNGQTFDIVKIFWEPRRLEDELRSLHWDIEVRRVGASILFGVGRPLPPS